MLDLLRSLAFWRPTHRPPPKGALSPMAQVPGGLARLPEGRRWVRGFTLDLRPVTNGDWLLFMQSSGAAAPPWMFRKGWQDIDQPVVGITQAEAVAFARWARKRLPSEAQWQRAVGASMYPWGEHEATHMHAVYGRRPGKGALPAMPDTRSRSLGCGPHGHGDLVGNVWERLQGGVARGGFWGSSDPRASLRLVLGPEERSAGVGLRCCR